MSAEKQAKAEAAATETTEQEVNLLDSILMRGCAVVTRKKRLGIRSFSPSSSER